MMRSAAVFLVAALHSFTISVLALPPLNESLLRGYRTIEDEEDGARAWLEEHDTKRAQNCYESTVASWNYSTDINDLNQEKQLNASLKFSKFGKESWYNFTSQFKSWISYKDPDLKRRISKSFVLGSFALSEDDLIKYNQLKNHMRKVHSTTKVCAYQNKTQCHLSLDSDVKRIMKESRDEGKLRHIWTEWHNKCGNPIRKSYQEFIALSNLAARLNNFTDSGAFWLRKYESNTIKEDFRKLYDTIAPLYKQFHAYARAKLRSIYPDQFSSDGLIPAHLLGNLFASGMEGIYSLLIPYPNKSSIDVTEEMKKQGYTPLKMFQKSEEFFTLLGLLPMPEKFWTDSLMVQPKNREIVCQATAWDFCNGKDYRIKQCTEIRMRDFITIHHEMGHIQYFLQYKDKPIVYREGANPGFHEAVGDTLALSVQTPKHLKELGLVDEATAIDDYETSINFLLEMAVKKVAPLPFAYIMDQYRWAIFDESVNASHYNSYWWDIRNRFQGIKPPVERSEDNFDPGTILHLVSHIEYSRYYVANIIQFQFHRALCKEAGQYDPIYPLKQLYNCNIYKSKLAGSKLAAGLAMGASRPWPEVMQAITGQEIMDASAIREYFKPLEDWLIKENARLGQTPGWSSSS